MERAFLRRSLLYVPGSSPRMIEKSTALAADSLIFDLEDAVSLAEKDNARAIVAAHLPRARASGKEIVVRVNAVSTHLGIRDLLAVVPQRPDTIIVPKADRASIIAADCVIGGLERELGWDAGTIGLVALAETAEAIVDAAALIAAAARINGVQLGAEDLTKELGIPRTAGGAELQYARSALVFAGRARGIDVIDTPFPDHADLAGLLAETRLATALGMTGKCCIHPAQIATVNAAFTPAEQEVAAAHRVVEAYAQALAAGRGATALDGKMIDPPVAERARRLIARHERIAVAPPSAGA